MLRLLLAVLILLTVQVAQAVEAEDEPELAAYPLNTLLKAGQVNELQVVVVNTAKPENVYGGDLERQLIQNATLTAYNLEIWLESDVFDVKSDKVYVQSLPPSASLKLSFLVSVPAEYRGEGLLRLRINYERVESVEVEWYGSNYTARYEYEEETKTIEIKVEVLEEAKPELSVFLLTPEVYAGDYSTLSFVVANTGLSELRSVVLAVDGFDDAVPAQHYIPALQPSQSQQIAFSVKGGNGSFSVKVEYAYFDAGKLIRAEESFQFSVPVKRLEGGVFIIPENPRVSRGEGVVEFSVMNAHLSPVTNLRLSFEATGEFELEKREVAVGSLPPGGVVRLLVPYSLDDDAKAGEKEWMVKIAYNLRADRIESFEEIRKLQLYLENDPHFVVVSKPVVYHGENIVTFLLLNAGGKAEDVHFKLIPSPGIRVKMPEAFAEVVEGGETLNISFSVDVDEDVIAGNEYRISLSWKAENEAGREISGVAYGYVVVEERAWYEKYFIAFALLILPLLALLLRRHV
ncbi:MAG: COG1361 S-layer family protein [Archaeoglobaceae archaeon]